MVPTEETAKANEEKQDVSAPTITLPKGGGAIHGMGEKFAANPVTGTGSMSVPIAISPGRSGFGPQLSLSYDSSAGNGPFGLGWNLSLPSITRKTDKGLPKYQDSEESDVFMLSGAEDLVPVLIDQGDATWKLESIKPRTVGDSTYNIKSYRPRIEGLFARIERWTNQADLTDIFWRSISKDNTTKWYGKTAESRIADPQDPSRIFSWLICQSHDDKGNVIVYGYQGENSDLVDLSQVHERNRGGVTDNLRSANRYLKRIRYGNHQPYLPILSVDKPWPVPQGADDLDGSKDWFFEVVFDYGEHNEAIPLPLETATKWPVRNDPFSSYRAGFEVRTYRLCQRVLMFHHFPGEADVEANCLVRSTDFNYSYENDPKNAKNPIYSFLESASHTSYKRKTGGGYLSKSLPPLEFTYTQPIIDETIQEVDSESLENLPFGLDGSSYQWVDLDGEGLSGILTEQGTGWFYKRNHSTNNISTDQATKAERTLACFSPVELVATKPNTMLAGGRAQFMDLAGDGQIDLVEMEGPVRGFYERTVDQDWETFQPFSSWPNVDTRDPNLKFIDLTGDGHADILISEDQAFIWHASLAEAGYGAAQQVQQQFDEELGPRLIFADSEQSIFLADLSGDGLTDLVRIRNGEVCYWPNLGYCRFGAKVTMDNSPWFDACDQFNPRRLRLADIDGSGTTDILYLHSKGVQIYFNQSGNSWSLATELPAFPAIDNLTAIQVMDFLGNGTASLVWSSPLPNFARSPMRYIDLMAQGKPHLLVSMKNNLGAETAIHYAPSTQFYLEDKDADKPWITKLPFPVHVVDKVTVTDKWRKTSFSSNYSYHHGYFDGIEREFRGFGRVEQVDIESYGEFKQGNIDSPYITEDHTLYQPPVKTVTWYHTGAFLDRERIITHFKHEYFPHSLEDQYPGQVKILNNFQEIDLPQPDLNAQGLTAEEWREALRACKGMMLRQEVYELDIEALESPTKPQQLPVKLYSTAYHNCHVQCLQPRNDNRFGVFLVAESEAITYHYELDIREPEITQLSPDPRIAHTLNLTYDEYANIQQSVAVVYPRLGQFEDNADLAAGLTDALSLIHDVQLERHLAYSETHYTKDFGTNPEDKAAALDNHRLRVPCEVMTYELTGIKPKSGNYFTLAELRHFRLSLKYQPDPDPLNKLVAVNGLPYQTPPNQAILGKRIVEHARTQFFAENLVNPLPFGEHGRLGLAYEAYKLALTDTLLDAVFKDSAGNNKLDQPIDGATSARTKLNDPAISGYLSGALLTTRFTSELIPVAELTGQYWIRSGIAGFASDAAQHFYLPERYTDPFDNVTTLEYDGKYDLYVASSTDMLQNKTSVTRFDFRVLAPREMQDINDNLSEVYFDLLGLPTAMAVKGKGTEGDNLTGYTDTIANPDLPQLTAFFVEAPYNEAQARDWLGNATARHVYYFGEIEEVLLGGKTITHWGEHPACACGIVREQHVAQLQGNALSPIQTAFEYSDGMGSVVVKKVQAEPAKKGDPLRWIANGKTILNNKGKPVKQYEPYFSSAGHLFEELKEEGVTPIIYYDAAGRTVRTEMPDGSYSKVDFSPWHVRTYDPNDTAFDPNSAERSDWYKRRMDSANPRFAEFNTTENTRAAKAVEVHGNTPSLTILDSLGRDVISIAHNRVKDAAGVLKDEKYITFTKLDAEGKPLWIRDARNNRVMQYISPPVPNDQAADPVKNFAPCYDIAGNLLFQHSMDAGNRWMINDAAGKPMVAWDNRDHNFYTDYDKLHRPVGSFVKGDDPAVANRIIQFEKILYGDTSGNGLIVDLVNPKNDQTKQLNLRGKPYQHFDTAGVVISKGINSATGADEAFDFKGNPIRSTRQLISEYKTTPDWSQLPPPALEAEIFSSTQYDALNRPIQLVALHSNQPGTKFNVIRPGYNEANLLERVDVWLEQTTEPTVLLNPTTANLKAVTNIDYDAKGQRVKIEYNEAGHPIITEYAYDNETLRLSHLFTTRPKHPEADKRNLQDLTYTYDPVGNITDIRDAAQQTVFFNNSIIKPSNTYDYDALYRLIHSEGREHAAQNNVQRDAKKSEPIIGIPFPNSPEALQRYREDYEYDPVGNILGFHHSSGAESWVRWYQYELDSNRLLGTRSPGEAGKLPFYAATSGYNAKYTYDAHGNMTSMPHLPTMEWDFKDQLHASQQQVVNNGTGEKTYYVYDAGGQRVRKVTETQNGNRKDERLYLGGFEVYRKYNGNGQTLILERETLHIMDDKERVALVETRTRLVGNDPGPQQLVRFQLGNHLGSTALELDDQALVISYEEYNPYGTTAYESARSQSETPKRYRYTGKERDEETGFSYHSARYYSGWLGRWVSADPIGVDAGSNVFSYVRCNPICLIDLKGTEDTPLAQKKDTSLSASTLLSVGWGLFQLTDAHKELVKPVLVLGEMTGKGAEKFVDQRQGIIKPDEAYVTKEQSREQLNAIIFVGGLLFPGLPKGKLSPSGPFTTSGGGELAFAEARSGGGKLALAEAATTTGIPSESGLLASAATKTPSSPGSSASKKTTPESPSPEGKWVDTFRSNNEGMRVQSKISGQPLKVLSDYAVMIKEYLIDGKEYDVFIEGANGKKPVLGVFGEVKGDYGRWFKNGDPLNPDVIEKLKELRSQARDLVQTAKKYNYEAKYYVKDDQEEIWKNILKDKEFDSIKYETWTR